MKLEIFSQFLKQKCINFFKKNQFIFIKIFENISIHRLKFIKQIYLIVII